MADDLPEQLKELDNTLAGIESVLDLLILCGLHRAYESPEETDYEQTYGVAGTPIPPPVSPTTGRTLNPDRFDA